MKTRQTASRARFSLALAAVLAVLAAVPSAFAAVGTDQMDYAPGSVVTISGDNSNGAGYVTGNDVDVAASADNGLWADSCSATVQADGSWSCTVTLSSDPSIAVGSYTYTATSTDADGNPISESGTFTDASLVDATLDIRDAACSTATTSFNSGATVCAHTVASTNGSGAGPDYYVYWIDPNGNQTSTHFTGVANNSVHDDTRTVSVSGTWTVKTCKNLPCAGANTLHTATFSVAGKTNQAALAVTGPTDGTYGHSYSITTSGGSGTGALSFSTGSSTACAIDGTNATQLDVTKGTGTCSITATKAGDSNYNSATSAAFKVTIHKATLTVTPDALTIVYGQADPTFTFGLSGLVNSESDQVIGDASGESKPACGTTSSTSPRPPGSYTITCSGGSDDNYSFDTSATATLTVIFAPEAVGLNSVSISATGVAVSSYTSPTMDVTTAHGTVASNVQVTLSGATVAGSVTAPSLVLQKGGDPGTYHQSNPMLDPVPVDLSGCNSFSPKASISGKFSYDPTKGDLTVSGGNSASLGTASSYCFHSVTISGGSKLYVTDAITITMTGQFNGSGGSLINLTYDPAKLQVSTTYAGNNAIVLSGGTNAYALLYAPNGGVTLSGGSPLYGAVLGKTLVMSGSSTAHCDLNDDSLEEWAQHFS